MNKPEIEFSGNFPYDYFGKHSDILDIKDRYLVEKGGGGSGKSHAIAQKFVFRCLDEYDADHRFLIVRKTQPSLRKSCFNLIRDKIKAFIETIPESLEKS